MLDIFLHFGKHLKFPVHELLELPDQLDIERQNGKRWRYISRPLVFTYSIEERHPVGTPGARGPIVSGSCRFDIVVRLKHDLFTLNIITMFEHQWRISAYTRAQTISMKSVCEASSPNSGNVRAKHPLQDI